MNGKRWESVRGQTITKNPELNDETANVEILQKCKRKSSPQT